MTETAELPIAQTARLGVYCDPREGAERELVVRELESSSCVHVGFAELNPLVNHLSAIEMLIRMGAPVESWPMLLRPREVPGRARSPVLAPSVEEVFALLKLRTERDERRAIAAAIDELAAAACAAEKPTVALCDALRDLVARLKRGER